MANYHLYYLQGGMFLGSDDIEAENDMEAARIAERQGRGELVEIWNAHSRVRIVRPAAAWPGRGSREVVADLTPQPASS